MQAIMITKDLIAQHNLTDDEYKKIVEILGGEPVSPVTEGSDS